MAAHIRGNIEIGVNPGIVFTSLMTSRSLAVGAGAEEEVDPRQAAAVHRQVGPAGGRCTSRGLLGGEVGRHVELDGVLEVLRVEVVPVGARLEPDLGGQARLGQPAVPRRRARRTRSPGPGTAASTTTFASTAAAVATAAGNCAQSVTRVMPMLEPARDGFTKTGRPEPLPGRLVEHGGVGHSAPAASRRTTWSPCGSPAAARSFLVNSLSIDAALAKTPEPT